MVFRLLRRLAGLAIAGLLVSLVTSHLGTALAARSMSQFVASVDAAQTGNTARADRLSVDLSIEWRSLASSVDTVRRSLDSWIDQLSPSR